MPGLIWSNFLPFGREVNCSQRRPEPGPTGVMARTRAAPKKSSCASERQARAPPTGAHTARAHWRDELFSGFFRSSLWINVRDLHGHVNAAHPDAVSFSPSPRAVTEMP